MKITENLHEIISNSRLYFYDDTVAAQCAIFLGKSQRLARAQIEENTYHSHWSKQNIAKSRIISQKLPGVYIKEKDIVVILARCFTISSYQEDIFRVKAKKEKNEFVYVCYYSSVLTLIGGIYLTFI